MPPDTSYANTDPLTPSTPPSGSQFPLMPLHPCRLLTPCWLSEPLHPCQPPIDPCMPFQPLHAPTPLLAADAPWHPYPLFPLTPLTPYWPLSSLHPWCFDMACWPPNTTYLQKKNLVVKSGTTAGKHDMSSACGSGCCFVRCTPPLIPPQFPHGEASGGWDWY